jgi:hypothetical protein
MIQQRRIHYGWGGRGGNVVDVGDGVRIALVLAARGRSILRQYKSRSRARMTGDSGVTGDLQGVLQLGNVVAIEDGGVAEELRRHGEDRDVGGWEWRLAGRGGEGGRGDGVQYLRLGRSRQIAGWEDIRARQISRLAAAPAQPPIPERERVCNIFVNTNKLLLN